jgi:hypothetical protein
VKFETVPDKCQKCQGSGWYQYSTVGTPHSKPCEVCCKHAKGRWLLKEHYGEDNGKWCCLDGCGTMWEKEHD